MTNTQTDSLSKSLKHWRHQQGLSLESVALKTRIPLKYLRALEINDFSTLPQIDAWPRTLGDSLRHYREQQGLALERISDQTRVPLVYLKALEENNALQMPAAPVIARSFVESYLSCLAIQESQKEDLLVQYAKLAEVVYAKPVEESAILPAHATDQARHTWVPSLAAVRDRYQTLIWTVYLAAVRQRARLCARLISGYHATLAWGRHVLHHIGTASVDAWQTTSHIAQFYAERIVTQTRGGKAQPTWWHDRLKALSPAGWPIRDPLVWMQRSLPSLSDWHLTHVPERTGRTVSLTDTATTHAQDQTGSPTRSWMIRHGFTAFLLILLGGTAGNIPVLTETRVIGTALKVSHLMEFFSYGTVLIVVGLFSRHIARLLDRDGSGVTFLRPLVTPLTTLLMVSALHKILLIIMNPFFSKADRLAYNWTFVLLILTSTVWIILAWFFRSAPLLESLSTHSHSQLPCNDATPSPCPRCNACPPPGMKFCGQCGERLTAPRD